MSAAPWHSQPLTRVLESVSSTGQGLSASEAAQRFATYGPNRLPVQPPPTSWQILLRQFQSPLIYVLVAAAVVAVVTGDIKDAGFIAAVLAINAVIGGYQEWRAEQSSRALQQLLHVRTSVVRDGEVREVDAEEIVPGDIVWLESGNRVPADLRLISAHGLEVDESLLTGESFAVGVALPLPFWPVQLLWLNLVTNGIQGIALAFEPGERGILRRKARRPSEPIFDQLMIERTIVAAVTMAVVGVAAFWWMIRSGWPADSARNGLLLLMVLFENIPIGNCRSETKSALALSPLRSPYLLGGAMCAILLHVAAMHLPFLQSVLRTEPVNLSTWVVMIGLALTIYIAMEVHKWTWNLPGVIYAQHDFAAGGFRLVRSNRVRQRELRAHHRANLAGVDQSSDFLQFRSPRLNDEERFTDAFVLRILLGCGDRDEPAARLQHAPRSPQRVAANGIEHRIHVFQPLLEPLRAIVDHVDCKGRPIVRYCPSD